LAYLILTVVTDITSTRLSFFRAESRCLSVAVILHLLTCDLFRFINRHHLRRPFIISFVFFHLLLWVTICMISLIERNY